MSILPGLHHIKTKIFPIFRKEYESDPNPPGAKVKAITLNEL